ncbi:hypothetical protein COU74_04630 [Candidatus Peregrinibacteria bacterium CG10_big_fil_rev_8_21_14_0_10_36_19]|nr:MAG: hypothetical protein COU74_04630 [Candidatus Peregrinibacteria bacterium CG10_big_fil_rev_8_21_14_0_10_36_19]
MVMSIKNNQQGFTLTEVLIGMMILTVAIVSATNLLIGLIDTNKNNVQTLQAYYLAQEGVEAVRNIRDTNWLHNADFKGDDYLFGIFDYGKTYSIELTSRGWEGSTWKELEDKGELKAYLPWEVSAFDSKFVNFYDESFRIDEKYFRHIDIVNACDEREDIPENDCENFMLVRSVVNFKDGNEDRNVSIETVLSNWKNGAI